MTRIITPAHLLYGINQFSAKNDVRYYLNGFAIYPVRQHIVATNGHVLCRGEFDSDTFWADTECGQENDHFILGESSGNSKGLKLPKPKADEHFAVIKFNIDSQTGSIHYTTVQDMNFLQDCEDMNQIPTTQITPFRLIDGEYVDYRRIMPKHADPISATYTALDAEYVGIISKAAKSFTNKGRPGLIFHIPDSNTCSVEVEIEDCKEITVVIMPRRSKAKEKSWHRDSKPREDAA